MRGRCGFLTLAGLVAALALPAFSQSLGEIAAKERERRKATKDPVKVYTDADVATVAPADTSGAAEAAATDAAATPSEGATTQTPEKTPDELRAEARTAWLAELQRKDAEIARLQAEIARLEAESNDTRGYLYGNRRTVALEQLDQARADLQKASDRRDEHLEAGRRQGFRRP